MTRDSVGQVLSRTDEGNQGLVCTSLLMTLHMQIGTDSAAEMPDKCLPSVQGFTKCQVSLAHMLLDASLQVLQHPGSHILHGTWENPLKHSPEITHPRLSSKYNQLILEGVAPAAWVCGTGIDRFNHEF